MISAPSQAGSDVSDDDKDKPPTRPSSNPKTYVSVPSGRIESHSHDGSFEGGSNKQTTLVCVPVYKNGFRPMLKCEDLASCDNPHVQKVLWEGLQLCTSKRPKDRPVETRRAMSDLVTIANSEIARDWERDVGDHTQASGAPRIVMRLMPDLGLSVDDPEGDLRDAPGTLVDNPHSPYAKRTKQSKDSNTVIEPLRKKDLVLSEEWKMRRSRDASKQAN